jgi:hypothetical protein
VTAPEWLTLVPGQVDRVSASELADQGLADWPDACGVAWDDDGSLLCRQHLSDPAVRQALPAQRSARATAVVLYGADLAHPIDALCRLCRAGAAP